MAAILRWGIPILAVLVLAAMIWIGYHQKWTGFGESMTSAGEPIPAKTLWNWLELLIIPVVLATGAVWFNWSQQQLEFAVTEERAQIERELEEERLKESRLQAYLDSMSDLLLHEHLRTSDVDSEVSQVARARTLTVLRHLDGERKGILLRFLKEAGLIDRADPVISLLDADLSEAKLFSVNLENAMLAGVDLRRADLQRTVLSGSSLVDANLGHALMLDAKLSEADLSGAQMFSTDLAGADLSGATLKGAKLFQTLLMNANLTDADLTGTAFSEANLSWANLTRADFTDSGGEFVNFKRADLRGAIIRTEQFACSDFTDAKFD